MDIGRDRNSEHYEQMYKLILEARRYSALNKVNPYIFRQLLIEFLQIDTIVAARAGIVEGDLVEYDKRVIEGFDREQIKKALDKLDIF